MNLSKSFALLSMCCATAAMAAAPASQPSAPTTAPAARPKPPAPPLAPRDSVEVTSPAVKAAFRVPKAWTALKASSSSGDYFAWDAVPEAARNSPKPQQRSFAVLLGGQCHPMTAAELADENRKGIRADAKTDVTFTRDEAVRWNDRDCWLLEYPSEAEFRITSSRNGKTTIRTETVKVVNQQFLWMENGTICSMNVSADAANAPAMLRLAEQVRATFAFGK